MTRDVAKDVIKGYLESYLQAKGINTRKPFSCLNPDHADKHPSMSYDNKRQRCKCFSCGASYDIFNLIGIDYGLSDYNAIFNKAYELYNIQLDNNIPYKPVEPIKTMNTQSDDYTRDFKKWHEALTDETAQKYLLHRGISNETANKYGLGYDEAYAINGFKRWKALIIPTGKETFVVRNMDENASDRYRNKGASMLYNPGALIGKKPVFIVEGEIDALSIIEAGQCATGLGSTGNKNKFIEYIADAIKTGKTLAPMILALDNDDAGNKCADEIAAALNDLHIAFYKPLNIYGVHKDANEALTANKSDLEAKLTEIVQESAAYFINLDNDTDEIKPVGAYIDLFKQHREEIKHNIRTGFTKLDIALGGGFSNELYVLGADTGTGKSAITSVLAQNIAAQGVDVLYYALEMGRDEFIARGASSISIDYSENPFDSSIKPIKFSEIINDTYDYNTNRFYKRPYEQYEPFINEYQRRYGQNLYIIEGGINGKSAKDIANAAKTFKSKHNVKQLAVFIDYLQLLSADHEDKLQRDQMTAMSTAIKVLKSLASQEGVTVFVISSMANDKKHQSVNDTSFKYSGDIGYTGGVLMGWNWRGVTDSNDETLKAEIIRTSKEIGYREMSLEILKQRNGERDNKIYFNYMPAYNHIREQ